jgi:hypothetical protein
LLLGLCWFSGQNILYAQEQEQHEDEEDSIYDDDDGYYSDWDGYIMELYSRGDQTFTMSLGASFPVIFLNDGTIVDHHIKPPVGGTGSLGYNYFLNARLFLGAEIGVQIYYTLGQNTLFLVPIGFRGGWQFRFNRFEFPLGVTVGMVIHRYLNFNYLGLFVKGGASGYFRFSPDWSFGLSADWNWFPQWPMDNGTPVRHKNMDANTVGVTLAARYHF